VLYIRHTSTDFGQNDAKMTGYEDCANQRNLTDKGRQEARAVGEVAVVRPRGDSAFAIVGRIRLQDWELLQ
jgi:broad specificity phosphatase PhoE